MLNASLNIYISHGFHRRTSSSKNSLMDNMMKKYSYPKNEVTAGVGYGVSFPPAILLTEFNKKSLNNFAKSKGGQQSRLSMYLVDLLTSKCVQKIDRSFKVR